MYRDSVSPVCRKRHHVSSLSLVTVSNLTPVEDVKLLQLYADGHENLARKSSRLLLRTRARRHLAIMNRSTSQLLLYVHISSYQMPQNSPLNL
jgi:hypothetical protein